MSDLLQVEDLTVRYGAGPVVRSIALQVPANSVVALLGANGAGKSSTLKAIAGLIPATGGMRFDGSDIRQWNERQRYRAGIVYVPEGREIVPDLTVDENLTLGSYRLTSAVRSKQRTMVLDFFPEIAGRLRSPAGLLSGGEQQMLAIGRGLMSSPRLLLLDEPSLGLAPKLVARVYERLARIQGKQALAALLVEQSFHTAARLASKAFVLRHGDVVGTLEGDQLRSREARDSAINAYLGARTDAVARAPVPASDVGEHA